MTLSRTGAGRVGAEARGSRGVQGVQELWGQGGEGRGQGRGAVGRGAVGRGFPALGTAAPGAGCSPNRLQQAAGGNRLCFPRAGLT